MKKIVDDERLIYKVCCLYYQDDMNQKEIGDYLGISRSSVLRMLQKGKEIGIVVGGTVEEGVVDVAFLAGQRELLF